MLNIFVNLSFTLGTIFNFMNTQDQLPPADKAINIVINKTAAELQNKYHLSLMGTGGSGDDKIIKTSSISFIVNQSLTLKQTRQLIIASAEEFLKNINADENLAPYLIERPFTEKNIKIKIAMRHPDLSTAYDPELTGVSLDKGVIRYFTNDPEEPHHFKSIIKETYEEALKKLAASESN